MSKRFFYLFLLTLFLCSFHVHAQSGSFKSRNSLLKSTSSKNLVKTAADYQWSINFPKHSSDKDTLHIIAIRVEFQRNDTSALTTGNGLFGIRGSNSREEQRYYQDSTYKFDNLPHDYSYFHNQLTALRNYYNKVSRGKLELAHSLYPAGRGETGISVPHTMTHYSPGWKRREENINQYWDRKTHGLMTFVKDAVTAAANDANSPFANLEQEDGVLWHTDDTGTKRKAVILIFHAGASYLTDGGLDGPAGANTPSDMIDAFIDREFFKYFKDTLGLGAAGITVRGKDNKDILIDEVMMCSETSNQDGLNWGIQGILVNQMARQLGIPDLFSTSSGVTAIGAFCIMDFAGYSAGQGFIPPYPSAWVRAFMGWDTPRTAGAGGSFNVRALSASFDSPRNNDTTILLIPINNNEYYLVENRQRNLSGDQNVFGYDGTVIKAYPFNVNVEANVKTLSDTSNVILEAKNNDVSLPASGILVWHVDERIIRQRMNYNFVNADSSYRGVRLVEADGLNVLGVEFTDMFYQAAFDYGGANYVFPHRTVKGNNPGGLVDSMGPYSRPSTRANDGGHSYLNLKFNYSNDSPRQERTLSFQNDTIINFSDSIFRVDIGYYRNYLKDGWPRRAAPDKFFDPLITEISVSPTSKDNVFALLSESGKFYLFSLGDNKQESYGDKETDLYHINFKGDTVSSSRVKYFDDLNSDGVFTFPTAIANKIFIPAKNSKLHIYNSADISDKKVIDLPAAPSSYVSGISSDMWVVGLANGQVVTGSAAVNITNTIILNSRSPVNAIAALKSEDDDGIFAVMQEDGTLSIINGNLTAVRQARVRNGIGPFTIVTGDLDKCGKSEIVVSDSRQGLWVYNQDLRLARGWSENPNDWANAYHIDPQNRKGREWYTKNFSAPALADINRSGNLDIVVSGTNGIYALNSRGALLSRWPAYLDNRYWYQRGSVTTSPIVVSDNSNQPLILFSSPTGERATFSITKIESADKNRGVVTFRRDDGTLDSLWDIGASTIDTILTIGDSLIYPYILPGGFVDALGADARRPLKKMNTWAIQQSRWPLSAGAPVTASPLIYRTQNDPVPDLFAAASSGMIYRWKLDGILTDSLYWPQNGFDAARSFAYGGVQTQQKDIVVVKDPITFWNYPNPTSRDDAYTTFKYQFNGRAANVRLDIHTITGKRMDTFRNLSGDFPDWNEFKVNLRKYGPGIYRCRMEATIGGKKYSKQ
ncbi:MAG: hypothetical protein FWE57_09505, partial [Chitinispirillia bacterium]|nr:hypothetical protein [Chitinispirillia bacterium]